MCQRFLDFLLWIESWSIYLHLPPNCWQYSHFQNSYTEDLTPNGMAFESGDFGRWLDLEEAMGGPHNGGRGWDGWMVSPTQWTWVWENSVRYWRTGRSGVLQFMGSQMVGHDWAREQQGHKKGKRQDISLTTTLCVHACTTEVMWGPNKKMPPENKKGLLADILTIYFPLSRTVGNVCC